MKNKGFTLIELLAVIVILAIIALIATPIILGIIEDARKSSIKISAENYVSAINQAIARKMLTEDVNYDLCIKKGVDDYECTIEQLTDSGLEIDVSGNNADNVIGAVFISNNQVIDYTLIIDNHEVSKNEDDMEISAISLDDIVKPIGTTIKFSETSETQKNLKFVANYYPSLVPDGITINKVGFLAVPKAALKDGEELTHNTNSVISGEIDPNKEGFNCGDSCLLGYKITGMQNMQSLNIITRFYINYTENGEEKIYYFDTLLENSIENVFRNMAKQLIVNFEIDGSTIPVVDESKELWEQNFDDIYNFVMKEEHQKLVNYYIDSVDNS